MSAEREKAARTVRDVLEKIRDAADMFRAGAVGHLPVLAVEFIPAPDSNLVFYTLDDFMRDAALALESDVPAEKLAERLEAARALLVEAQARTSDPSFARRIASHLDNAD